MKTTVGRFTARYQPGDHYIELWKGERAVDIMVNLFDYKNDKVEVLKRSDFLEYVNNWKEESLFDYESEYEYL